MAPLSRIPKLGHCSKAGGRLIHRLNGFLSLAYSTGPDETDEQLAFWVGAQEQQAACELLWRIFDIDACVLSPTAP